MMISGNHSNFHNIGKPSYRGRYNHKGTPGRANAYFSHGGSVASRNIDPNVQNNKCCNCGGNDHLKKKLSCYE